MKARDAKLTLAVLWIAAAATGLLVALVPILDGDPAARLMAALLLAASLPYGLLRPSVPALWAVAIAWPTVVVRLGQDAGWQSVLLLGYTLVGLYGGDWLATWWSERYGADSAAAVAAARAGGGASAVPAAVVDGLPSPVPGRWAAARRRGDETYEPAAPLPDRPASRFRR